MDPLPEYTKLCFLALYNSTNEMAYDALKEHGLHIISYLRKAVLSATLNSFYYMLFVGIFIGEWKLRHTVSIRHNSS